MSSRRPKRPLNKDAVKSANAAIWRRFPELKGRKLTMDPKDQVYRKQWMDEYLAAGGELENPDDNGSDTKVVQACEKSPPKIFKPKLIENGADIITKSALYKDCSKDIKGKINSKKFNESEQKLIAEVLDKYAALLKCKDHPLKAIGRTDRAITKNGTCVDESKTMGEWFADKGALILTDSANNTIDFKDESTQFKGTLAHEISHALMNKYDPRTCKSYSSITENPLMKEFMNAAGWSKKGTILKDKSSAPTNYAKTSPEEDLAESSMLFLYNSDALKKKSPARYKFLKKLFGD